MNEEIIAFIRQNPDGVDSVELAQRFLKFRSPDPQLARTAIGAILKNEKRCSRTSEGKWVAVRAGSSGVSLSSLPCVAVYVLTPPQDPRTVHHVSVWKVNPRPEMQLALWIRDPEALAPDEQQQLVGPRDVPYDPQAWECARDTIAALMETHLPVYISWQHQGLLMREFAAAADSLPDEALLVSELLRSAGVSVPRPLTLDSLGLVVPGTDRPAASAFQRGELFATQVAEILRMLRRAGLETIEDLRNRESREIDDTDFAGKAFTRQTLLEQPHGCGVYAFKDQQGQFLYIGKSRNVRQRLLHYFQPSDESPAKLQRLRRESHSLSVHPCGSELESLIYEYRLIRKHSPILNTQIDIHERPGTFRPLRDCVVLLEHAEEEMVMSFWFKQGEKILLRALDAGFSADDALVRDLEEFFFSKTRPEATDFAEMEIAFRWIKRHQDSLALVTIDSVGSAEALYDAMRSAWQEYRGG